MPNWCQNKLEITFPESQREALRNALFADLSQNIDKLELSFNKVVPMPEHLELSSSVWDKDITMEKRQEINLATYGYPDWYEWCIAKWGCKWNAYSTMVLFDDESYISVLFDTPWSPPEYWFRALCEKFPDIDASLSYWEPGMWFAGDLQSDQEGGCYHIDVEDVKQFAIDVFDEVFDDEDE